MRLRLALITLMVATLVAGGFAAVELSRVGTSRGYAPEQPIAFSHTLHAGESEIPCLYCHGGARTSRHAGIPSLNVCMNCHAILTRQTREIEKLKEAVQRRQPIAWTRVHNLPDFVYFNHSRHVLTRTADFPSGVPCQTCHGPVETMARIEQVTELTMGWCLTCHREHAGIPTSTLERAAKRFSERPKPVTGTDCASCHY